MAAAPFPIDLTAPAFGATMMATALSLAAFEKGGIVPGSGAVPIVAHAGEKILPQHLSHFVQQSAKSGGQISDRARSGGDTHNHTHFNHSTNISSMSALDGASVRGMLEEHADWLGKLRSRAVRRNFRTNGVGG